MKKNVAGQRIGAQILTAADGTAFTGTVTVYVTGDAGTQAVGSVSSGACVHEGNGYHTYAPAQAESNYDLVAFTFIGTGAVPVTVQVFTTFPQTGDSFARLGAPAGASFSADIAAIDTKTTNLPTDPADQSLIIDATNALMTALADVPTNAELATALGTADDAVLAAIAALNNLNSAAAQAAAEAALAAYGAAKTTDVTKLQQATIVRNSSGIEQFPMYLTGTFTAAPGVTVTAERSFDDGAYAAAEGSIVEVGDGMYAFLYAAADSNCPDSGSWKFSATGCKDTVITFSTSG